MNTAICCQFELGLAIITACVPQAKIVVTRLVSPNSSTLQSSANRTPQIHSKPTLHTGDRRFADDKKINASISSSNSDSVVDYWSQHALEQGKKQQQELQFDVPARGRTRSEEAEEIYAKLPTALPTTVPPWMVNSRTIKVDDELWEMQTRRA